MDPSDAYRYSISSLLVSDFITLEYYDDMASIIADLTSPQQVSQSVDFKSKDQQKSPPCSVKNPLLARKILKQSIFKESQC
jgi:hypothetical protein